MESKKAVSFFVKLEREPRAARSSRKTDEFYDAENAMTDEEWIQKYASTRPKGFKDAKWYEGDFGPALPAGVLRRRLEPKLLPLLDNECDFTKWTPAAGGGSAGLSTAAAANNC